MRPRRPTLAAALALGAALTIPLAPAPAAGQDGLDALCVPATGPVPECYLAAGSARSVLPRIGTALWGGSPVPGTASTLGMRLGTMPRISVSGRVAVVPTTLPPLLDRGTDASETAWVTGLSAQATVGLLGGLSPLPTVGGVLSLDAIVRGSWAALPSDRGFDGGAWGWMAGLRVGALRESFTLPGVSLTGSYGRSSTVTYGDPEGGTTDGFWEGAVSDLNATLAASKRIGPVGVTAGVAVDRYASDVRIGYRTTPLGPQVVGTGDAEMDRWSGFLNASWSLMIFHASLEAGWQETPEPGGIPQGVEADPAGWWAGVAFRMSI